MGVYPTSGLVPSPSQKGSELHTWALHSTNAVQPLIKPCLVQNVRRWDLVNVQEEQMSVSSGCNTVHVRTMSQAANQRQCTCIRYCVCFILEAIHTLDKDWGQDEIRGGHPSD